MGTQTKTSFKSKNYISTCRPLELLQMDPFRPTMTCSPGGKRYTVVAVGGYTRFTSVTFLAAKDEAFKTFSKLCRKLRNEKALMISKSRSGHGGK